MKQLVVLSLTVVLMACSTHYAKLGATRQDYDRDYAECLQQTAGPALWLPVVLIFPIAGAVKNNTDWKPKRQACMRAKGYVIGDSGFKQYE